MVTIEHGTIRKSGIKYVACEQLQHDTEAFMYAIGGKLPNYPVPSLYCFSLIARNVDQRACDMNTTDMLLSLL